MGIISHLGFEINLLTKVKQKPGVTCYSFFQISGVYIWDLYNSLNHLNHGLKVVTSTIQSVDPSAQSTASLLY